MHVRPVILLVVAALVGGCTDSAIKEAVREELSDPESAKFLTIRVVGAKACVEYNAKNDMGGFMGLTRATVEKRNGRWQVSQLEGHYCSI